MTDYDSGVPLRVLSYNVRSLRDDVHAVVRVIRRIAPDVVCVQEAPRFFRWRFKIADLARRANLSYVAGGRHAGATAILVAPRVDVRDRIERQFTKTRGLHQRGATMVKLQVAGAELTATSIHMSLDGDERVRHLAELRELVETIPAPHRLIAGDVNETPDKPLWRGLAEVMQDAYACAPSGGELTYSADRPRRRIDGVFVTEGIKVLTCGVPQEPDALRDYVRATDHLPLVAELRIPR